jgi:hypothetical protein
MQTNTAQNENIERAFDTITDIDIAAVKRDRAMLAAMKEEYKELAQELQQREQDIIDRIEAGAFVMGEAWVVARRRQNISWLTVCKRELGERGVLDARDKWPTTFYKELRVD